MTEFTIGTDPEFMLVNEKNQLISAIGILPKKTLRNKFYFDNVLAEIAVDPAKSKEDFVQNIKNSLKELSKLIAPNKFIIKSCDQYPAKELICEDATRAGCNPELSAYTAGIIEPSEKAIKLKDGYFHFQTPVRTAGGHIHLGSTFFQSINEIFSVVKMMDLFLGVPSIFIDKDPSSKTRRKIYGHAGSCRLCEDGFRVEYRALSNFWFSSPEHVELVYDLCQFTIEFVKNKEHHKFWSQEDLFICNGYDHNLLQKAINNYDKKLADKFILLSNRCLTKKLISRIELFSQKNRIDPYLSWEI